jgi:transposase-like protein
VVPRRRGVRGHLAWLRWGDLEFVCPSCGAIAHGWRRGDGRAYDCGACGSRSSVTAGTLFDRTRTPLSVWFRVAWEMTARANGVSARSLQRSLGLGSYQTAWMMTHRYRRAMVMPGRAKLSGLVEVDETTVGGRNLPGHPGRSLHPNRIIVLTMVENLGKSGAGGTGKGIGRARLAVMPNYKADSINAVLLDNIEPGTKVLTDAYGSLSKALEGFEHVAINTKRSGIDAHVLYPAVSRVQAQLKRWLHGTHQGAVSRAHMNEYLWEFEFRFNRRHARKPGLLFYRLLEQAVRTDPITYGDVAVGGKKRKVSPTPPGTRGNPRSLAQPDAGRPWRRVVR